MIPKRAHYIWLGREMPWIHSLALRSALRRAGLERVVLHTTDDLSHHAWAKELRNFEGFELRPLDPGLLLEKARDGKLVDLYRRLPDARARANVLRVALLAVEGGVYLDCDTLTIGSLAELCENSSAFCGLERLVFPASLSWFGQPFGFALALFRSLARDCMRRLPEGWRAFRRVERWYPARVNNAVLGATPRHHFLESLLDRMLEVPARRLNVRYELGTTLLQRAVSEFRGSDLKLYPPEVFYPLGPEISEHWFRRARPESVNDVVSERTRVVHWYASVRTRRVVREASPEWVRAHAGSQLFSSLALQFLD